MEFIDRPEDTRHHYFGSLAAIYTELTHEELGVSYSTLRNLNIRPGHPYRNSLCIIRRDKLITIPKEACNTEKTGSGE